MIIYKESSELNYIPFFNGSTIYPTCTCSNYTGSFNYENMLDVCSISTYCNSPTTIISTIDYNSIKALRLYKSGGGNSCFTFCDNIFEKSNKHEISFDSYVCKSTCTRFCIYYGITDGSCNITLFSKSCDANNYYSVFQYLNNYFNLVLCNSECKLYQYNNSVICVHNLTGWNINNIKEYFSMYNTINYGQCAYFTIKGRGNSYINCIYNKTILNIC